MLGHQETEEGAIENVVELEWESKHQSGLGVSETQRQIDSLCKGYTKPQIKWILSWCKANWKVKQIVKIILYQVFK